MSDWDPMDYPPYAATVDRVIRGQRRRAGITDAPLYPSQDGPGAGTVVVVRPHGAEADGLGAAVEAAIREGIGALKG
jgi:hypothetical protein